MATPHPVHPTLPYFGDAGERRAPLAGVTFLEITHTAQLDVVGLAEWFDQHVVAAGCMPRLSVVAEPPAGTVSLRPSAGAAARVHAELPKMLHMARQRVVGALRGLVAAPSSDDRFLHASIFLNRVRREEGRWIARPEPTAPLSGIVLTLFAVAILSERSLYDRLMCVCDVCGRVSFDATPEMRRACPLHPPRGGAGTKTTPRGMASALVKPEDAGKSGSTPE